MLLCHGKTFAFLLSLIHNCSAYQHETTPNFTPILPHKILENRIITCRIIKITINFFWKLRIFVKILPFPNPAITKVRGEKTQQYHGLQFLCAMYCDCLFVSSLFFTFSRRPFLPSITESYRITCICQQTSLKDWCVCERLIRVVVKRTPLEMAKPGLLNSHAWISLSDRPIFYSNPIKELIKRKFTKETSYQNIIRLLRITSWNTASNP